MRRRHYAGLRLYIFEPGGPSVIAETTDMLRIAAIVPCHNEETAVARWSPICRPRCPNRGLRLRQREHRSHGRGRRGRGRRGAVEQVRGKGNVIRRAMADIDADVYLMIDGDDTYDASAAPAMIRMLLEGPYDQVTGVRVGRSDGAYRSGHELATAYSTGSSR